MKAIQVFGATGAVGGCLLVRALAESRPVLAVTRRIAAIDAPSAFEAKVEWLSFDLCHDRAPTLARSIISAGPLDAFAQWLHNVDTPDLQKVVALSSMSAESKRNAVDPAERALAARILAAEEKLIESCEKRRIRWTLLRPTLIWGTGTDRSVTPLYRFARRFRVAPVPMPIGGLRQPVHADDVARACLASLSTDAAANRIIPIGGGEILPVSILWRRVIEQAKARALPLPRSLLLHCARLMREQGGALRNSWQRWNQDQIAPEHRALAELLPQRQGFQPRPTHFGEDRNPR